MGSEFQMMTPCVSVVMSVHNGARDLPATLDSVLTQQGVDLEFIIIDDGSTDESGAILDDHAARDPRIRVIHQANTGLTRALIRGCALARGEYIARQDVGDLSLPGRFRKQLDLLRNETDIAFVSCWSEVAGPAGELLYEIRRDAMDCTEIMHALGEFLAGPTHHGTVMFRRRLYEVVGGYRHSFYFAQDIDLWLRLVEKGRFLVIPEILYRVQMAPDTITGTHRKEQVTLKALALGLARERRSGGESPETLSRAGAVKPRSVETLTKRARRAASNYFIGECLRRRGDPRAATYLLRALKLMPFNFRAGVRLLQSMMRPSASIEKENHES